MNTTHYEYLCKIILELSHLHMKINQESNERYVPPRVKMVEISTRSHILSVSDPVSQWESGSSSESDMDEEGGW